MQTIIINGDRYTVTPLDCHPEVAVAAYRVTKAGGQSYDVHMTPAGHLDCECAGCVYHQKPCRHINALLALGMFPSVAAAA